MRVLDKGEELVGLRVRIFLFHLLGEYSTGGVILRIIV